MNEQGKDWRVRIKSGATFIPIGGETTCRIGRSSQEQDISDKDSGVYGGTTYGQQKITIACSGNLKLPDAGFTAVENAGKASPPQVEVQVAKGSTIKFQGLVAVGNFNAEFPKDGPATWSFDLANVGAPTVDNISAVDVQP